MNEYRVVLETCGPNKVEVIKLLKEELQIGLQEAKDLSDMSHCVVLETPDKDKAYKLLFALRNLKADAIITHNDGPVDVDNEEGSISAVELFRQHFKNPWTDNNSYAFSCYPYIPEDKLRVARNLFGIDPSETILTIHNTAPIWRSMSSATVMTDAAIYYLSEDRDNQFEIRFTDIGEVTYQEMVLYFYDRSGEHYATLGIHDLLCYNSYGQEGEHGEYMASLLTAMARSVETPQDPYDEILKLEEEEKYDDALQLLELSASSGSVAKDWKYHFYKGRFLVKRESTLDEHPDENFKIIDKEFDKAIELSEDEHIGGYCNYWMGYLYHYIGQYYNARNSFILAMEADSEEMKDDSKEKVEWEENNKLSEIWENYTSKYEYKDRKFIMPIKDRDIAGCVVDGIDTFRLSNVPSCIKFPTGHPVANELYIGHPYNPDIYVPYSESEDIFFLDKIDELTYLLQCLGAEEIEITSIKGRSVSEYENRSGQVSAHLDNGLADVNGTYGKSSKNDRSRDSQLQQSFKIKCDPMRYPYVPEGLIWYDEQTRWQRMVEGRLNGNRLEYSESISSTDTRFVSNTEKKDIKAAAEYLWIKADGSAESNLETQFKEHTETQWRVDVKFRSLRDFNETYNQAVSSASKITNSKEEGNAQNAKTKEENEFYMPIEDSFFIKGVGTVVTGRVKAGALKENEDLFLFNPSGEKYRTTCKGIEMFRKRQPRCEIDDNVGILLSNIVQSDIENGAWLQKGEDAFNLETPSGTISPEIQAVNGGPLKNSAITECEQDYLEMYNEYAAEGEITERDRKMLDKFRVRCGISEERAREIEESCKKPQLTEDEQEYLEMYKEYAADGEISERDRKMLNKMRDRMGISEERAKEIEKL